jgi:hypothetical protein
MKRMADEDMQIAEDEQLEIRAGTWDLLLNAAALVVEEVEAAAQDLRRGVEAAETVIGEWMARRFLLRYGAAFADRLLAGAKTLHRRLDEGRAAGWAYPHEGFLNSVAEEMLMAIVIDLADERSSSLEESEDLETLRTLSFPPPQPPAGLADSARQSAWLAEKAPGEIDRAVQIFVNPVRLPARLPPGSVLAHAVTNADSTTYGTFVHSLDVWFRLPSGGSLHIWQTDDPTGLAAEGKDPVLSGRPIAIGSRIWTRTDLQDSPGISAFNTRFEDGVTLSIDFPVSEVDFEALLSSVIAVQPS